MMFTNLRRQVLVPLSLTFLVLLLIFLYSAYSIRRDNISSALDLHYHEAQSLFSELLTIRSEWMIAMSEVIINDPQLKSAMRRGDRAALYQHALPHYRRISGPDGITHFYFHGPDARNFLRVYRPEQYGDVITRDTMRRAMETGNPAHGLELGSSGTLTLRLVIPWYDRNGLMGFVELGSEVESTLRSLTNISHVDYLVTINKQLLEQKSWEAAMLKLGRRPEWDLMPSKVVSSHSLDSLPESVVSMLSRQRSSTFDGEEWQDAQVDNRRFAIKRFPLLETSGRVVGDFVLLYEITLIASEFKQFIFKVLLFGVVVCSLLFVFAWRVLGQVEKNLQGAQQKLADEIANVHQANRLMELEVSERQRVEAALMQLNDTLEERVSERTRKLELMSRELEKGRNDLEQAYTELKSRQAMILHQDKMASIGLLAAGVAHDINNPIGFVNNNLEELRIYMANLQRYFDAQEMVVQKTAGPEDRELLLQEREHLGIDYIFEDFKALIEESLEGAGRVSSIVKNLRSFSRVDDVEYKLADINECLDSTINITHHELRYKALVVRDYGDIPQIRCCPQQLNQVFMNLLINAGHAIEKRGEVTVSTWQEGESVLVSISDTGCGIPEELQSRIFEPFFTTKESGKGTGLGLSIVSDIVRQHRGEITVYSKPGEGTTFTIRLPLDAGDGTTCACQINAPEKGYVLTGGGND